MKFVSKRARIVEGNARAYKNCPYELQVWRWWFPCWLFVDAFATMEQAREAGRRVLNPHVEYIDDGAQ